MASITARSIALIIATWLGSASAWAAPTLVTGQPIIADGRTPARLVLLVPGAQTGAKVKIKVPGGRLDEVSVVAPGRVEARYMPDRVTEGTELELTVEVKGAEGGTVRVPVIPPREGDIDVKLDPDRWRLGEKGGVTVRLTPPHDTARDPKARSFMVQATVGKLDPPVLVGDGQWVARWTPPATQAPGTAVLMFADAAAPHVVWGLARLPMTVQQAVVVDAPQGTSNVLVAGGRTYGPLVADAKGKVSFNVLLAPDQPSGELTTVTAGGARSSRVVELPTGDHGGVGFLPLPSAIPADPSLRVPVRVIATDLDGRPARSGSVTLEASAGAFAGVHGITGHDGVFEATYTPPATGAEAVLIARHKRSNGSEGVTQAVVRLVAPLPTLEIEVDVARLAAKQEAAVTARGIGPDGASVKVFPPFQSGADAVGKAATAADGSNTMRLRGQAAQPDLVLIGDPDVQATGLHPWRLLAWGSPAVAQGGKTQSWVIITAVDALGVPVPKVDLQLSAMGATVAAKAQTDARGIARVPVQVDPAAGVAVLTAIGAGLQAQLSLDMGGALVSQGSGELAAIEAQARVQRAVPIKIVPGDRPLVLAAGDSAATGAAAAADASAATPAADATGADLAAAGPSGASGVAPVALRLSVAGGPHLRRGQQRTDDSDVLIDDVDFQSGPLDLMGGDLRVLAGAGVVAFDGRLRAYPEETQAEGEDFDHLAWTLLAGLRLQAKQPARLRPYGLLQGERLDEVLFAWDGADPAQAVKGMLGLRVGGGLQISVRRAWFDLQLAETFAPYPVQSTALLAGELHVVGPLNVRLAYDAELRSFTFDVDDSEARIVSRTQGLTAGLGLQF